MMRTERNSGFLTPEGIMLLMLAFGLTAFGMVMIYSASSIKALTESASDYNAAYYLGKQLVAAFLGLLMGGAAWLLDYRMWGRQWLMVIWVLTILSLLIVVGTSAGADAYGATRWIRVGPLTIQPSEFAKATILVAAAGLLHQYEEEQSLTQVELIMRAAIFVAIPLVLILAQPDKGTVMVCGATIVLLMYLADMPLGYVLTLVGVGMALMLYLAFHDEYSRARIMIMNDPWKDEYGDGYQLIQGYYAFASGGLFGVGLGNSRQKYAYLPMAHNDFIFAVIGEELGLVGTLAVLACFGLLVYLGFRIARNAPDLFGRLIAAGSTSMLAIQLLLNVSGVLGLMPLSGKPIPFLSYGGSSIMSTLLLVGMVLSVSRATCARQADRGFVVVEGNSLRSLRVLEGGASGRRDRSPDTLRRSQRQAERGRVSVNTNGTRRVDLGPSARERLRGNGR